MKNVRAVLLEDAVPHKTGEQFSSAYEAALETGITVSRDTYAELNKIADRLLVPATDASRMGAGE